tara:strand:+ start:1779 stop:2126 length:348 start_codon:yes stop_codon:yes gene_type:complete
MPLYDFECEPCAYYAEIRQGMSDPSTLKCPICEQKTLKKVFLSAPHIAVRGEPTTIGQMAELNSKKMGSYERQEKSEKDSNGTRLTTEQKQKRKEYQKIVSMTPEQKVKWIKEGD